MDPDATFDAMIAAARAGNWSTAGVRAEDLFEWVDSGGFEPARPNWRASANDVYDRALAALRGRTVASESGIGLTTIN